MSDVPTHFGITPTDGLIISQETGEILNYSVFFRTGFNYDRDQASIDSGLVCLEATKTQQQFADDADINVIVRRFGLTGQLPENLRFPSFGDFSGINNLQDALNIARQAQEQFDLIPAEIRAEFNNDPHTFLQATADPRNLPRLRELGLAKPLGLADPEKSPPEAPTPPPKAKKGDPEQSSP